MTGLKLSLIPSCPFSAQSIEVPSFPANDLYVYYHFTLWNSILARKRNKTNPNIAGMANALFTLPPAWKCKQILKCISIKECFLELHCTNVSSLWPRQFQEYLCLGRIRSIRDWKYWNTSVYILVYLANYGLDVWKVEIYVLKWGVKEMISVKESDGGEDKQKGKKGETSTRRR